MKRILVLFGILLLVMIATKVFTDVSAGKPFPFFTKPQAVLGKKTINLKVAKTQQEKQIGLSMTKTLSDDEGMVFLFDKPDYYSFWMKDMKFPIDIIYLKNNKIVALYENVQPPAKETEIPEILNSQEPADTVLEVHAGQARKNNLKKGDIIKINL